MISRSLKIPGAITAAVALSLGIAACTSNQPKHDPTPTATATASATSPDPGVSTTAGALVAGFPATIVQLPDSQIVSSTVGPAPTPGEGDAGSDDAGKDDSGSGDSAKSAAEKTDAGASDAGKTEASTGDAGEKDRVTAALIMKSDKPVKDIFDFYRKDLEKKGFSLVAEPDLSKTVVQASFIRDNGAQIVSVSTDPAPGDKNQFTVTVSGTVAK